jgi:hypothetical protein
MKLLVNPNPISLWRDIIQEAKTTCAAPLEDELESYLVLLLARFSNKPEIVKQIMATKFLESVNLSPRQRAAAFQHIGDTCLIFSGLFPGIVEKRLVKISYFIGLGQAAYMTASRTNHDVFYGLAQQFVVLMDILQSTRQYTRDCPDLLPLQAYELWNESGSQRALQVLRQYTRGMPVEVALKNSNNPLLKKTF